MNTKSIILILIFLAVFTSNSSAITYYKGGTNTMPEPLPESAGQLIYEEMGCPICHGFQGEGDGFMAGGLNPKPRNFTNFDEMGRLSDMEMFEAIQKGIPGTSMPAWNLSENQIWDVISYINTFLADSQLTITLCLNELRKVDIQNLDIEGRYQFGIDREHFVNVSAIGNTIVIEPEFYHLVPYFKTTKQELVRAHIMIVGKGENGNTALIVVRIRNCIK